MGVHSLNEVVICVPPPGVCTVHQIAYTAQLRGVQECGKCLHLRRWGVGISCKWECDTGVFHLQCWPRVVIFDFFRLQDGLDGHQAEAQLQVDSGANLSGVHQLVRTGTNQENTVGKWLKQESPAVYCTVVIQTINSFQWLIAQPFTCFFTASKWFKQEISPSSRWEFWGKYTSFRIRLINVQKMEGPSRKNGCDNVISCQHKFWP